MQFLSLFSLQNLFSSRKKLLLCILMTLIFFSSLIHWHYKSCGEIWVNSFINCAKTTGLNGEEKQILYRTVKALDEVFNFYEISYFICCGTLLGYARHGQIIPYDDDLDIFVERKDLLKIKRVFDDIHYNEANNNNNDSDSDNNNNNFSLSSTTTATAAAAAAGLINKNKDVQLLHYAETPTILKVHLKLPNCFHPQGVSWCFPFIDVILLEEITSSSSSSTATTTTTTKDQTKIIDNSNNNKLFLEVGTNVKFKGKDIYPLKRAKLNGLNIWIPNNIPALLSYPHFSSHTCFTGGYSHRSEANSNCLRIIPCHCLNGRWDETNMK